MNKIYDLIIIGGGSAGLSASIYAGRAKLNTLIIEKDSMGGQIKTTSEIVNYPAIRHTSGPALIEEMKHQALDFGVQFATAEVLSVDFKDNVKILETSNGTYQAYAIIIATGASPRKLGFPGEAEFTGRGVAYCSTCDGELFEGLDVFVIGAGFAAAEEAIFLTRFAKNVTVIAREPEFTCAKTIADKVLAHPKIKVHFNTEILEAKGHNNLQEAHFINNVTGETFTYKASEKDGTFGIFIFVGYAPATSLFKGHVEMDAAGYIPTDENMQTNIPGIYAAGDLRPKALRQVVTAVADGAIAATDAEKYIAALKDKLGVEVAPPLASTKPSIPNANTQTETPSTPAPEEGKSKLLTPELRVQLKQILAKLERPVTLASVVDPNNGKSVELRDLILDIADLSEHISTLITRRHENKNLEEKIHADKFPVVAFLDEQGNYTGVKFHGVPGGHELNSFILALYNLAGPGQPIDSNIVTQIKALTNPVNIKVAVSLSCHLCPDVVALAQRIALLNPNVETEMLDISLFKELKNDFKIMSVPALIVNDENVYFGAKKLEEILTLLP